MAGILFKPPCAFIRLDVSIPSMPDIFQSITTSSKGLSACAFSSSVIPSGPDAATVTSKVKDSSISCKISLEVALSSTTKTLMPRSSDAGLYCFLAFSSPRPKLAVKLKVLPRPCSLSTQISPPIISASRLLIVSPKPVPPYLRVVEESACING